MSPLARLLGLFLPPCAARGAGGLPTLGVVDLHRINLRTRNAALAAPTGFSPRPDFTVGSYSLAPDQLYAAMGTVAARQPRTFPAAEYPEQLQLHFVARSALANFPDLITAQVLPADRAASSFALYSRSVYGYSDFGVNRRRLSVWLAAADSLLGQSAER